MELTNFVSLGQLRVGLPSGEDIWLDLEEGLNLVYGKNGSGKSIAIRSITKVFNQSRVEDSGKVSNSQYNSERPLVTAYYETDFIEVVEFLLIFLGQFSDFLRAEQIEVATPSALFGSDEDLALVKHRYSSSDPMAGDGVSELLAGFDKWSETLENIIDEEEHISILRKVVETRGRKFLEVFEDIKLLFNQFRFGLRKAYSDIYSTLTVEEANEALTSFGLTTQLESDCLADRSFESLSWSQLVDLYIVSLAMDYEDLLAQPGSEWLNDGDDEENSISLEQVIPQTRKAASNVLMALENQKSCPTFWVEPTNRRDGRRKMGLALGRRRDAEFTKDIDKNTRNVIAAYDEVYAIYEEQISKDLEGDYSGKVLFDAVAHFLANRVVTTRTVADWSFDNFDDRELSFQTYSSNSRYVNLHSGGAFLVNDYPIKILNLDEKVDLELIAQRTLFRLVQYYLKEATFLKSDFERESSVEFEDEGLKEVGDFTTRVSHFLASLDIGIRSCEFRYSGDLGSWAFGNGATFVFLTDSCREGEGIPFESLSSGQQYWVNAAFRICFAEQSGRGYLLIADEPERGLHERAASAAFSALAGLSATSLIATHSVSALRFAGARLMHFERDDNGQIRVTEPQLGDDVSKAAKRFGTTTFDLFSLKRALVVVEGAHDVEIIRHLATCSQTPHLLDRLLIVPSRGVRNVATIADSVVITEFTNLHILTIVDNGRTAALQEIVARASSALESGKSTQQAISESGIRELAQNSSFEERSILDLVERAIHRRILGRLHLLALEVPDIVDLLPESSFGLNKSWDQLRKEFKKSVNSDGFKSWLKMEYGVSISIKTVSKALHQLDAIEGELHRISSELEIVASLSPLDAQL